MSYFKPSGNNSTLFVELLNNRSDIIVKKILPVFNAITYGQIELPDSLSTGYYWLRAYSPLMLNQNRSYLYTSPVRIFGQSKGNKQNSQPAVTVNTSLQFFPEGGNLIAGVSNTVAFKATDINGNPLHISGFVKDDAGDTITTFTSFHDGMGKFSFIPKADNQYTAIINGGGQPYPLPAAAINGVALHADLMAGKINYTVRTNSSWQQDFTPAFIIAQMQNKVVAQQQVEPLKNNISRGSLPVKELHSGILQLTFFNKDKAPLAERLFFINNKEYTLQGILHTQAANTGARKENNFTIQLTDSIEGDFSVAVTDADYDEPGNRKENIISSFLLTADLPGIINNPSWYLSDDEKAPEALDLVMLTNGWRRFRWSEVAQNHLPEPVYKDPGYISLSGKVNIRSSKKSFADRDLLIWTTTPNADRSLQMIKTDAQGNFKMDSLVFFDKARILFSDVMGNKSKFITVKLDADSLYKTYKLPDLQTTFITRQDDAKALSARMQSAYFDYARGEGLLLDNVAIEGKKLTEDELEKKYMSGLFSGNINARTINLTGQFIPQWNIFEWLTGRIPSLQIDHSGNLGDNYRLTYRRQPVQLFLDEMPINDASFISSIPANQIALLKLFPQFIGARGNNAALAVYTKRGDDLSDEIDATGDIVDYDGYSIIKEYYSPDYAAPAELNYRDYRLTLNWQPQVRVSGNNIPVRFYNNDRTKRFRVVVEGFTRDGKLLMIEKIIEPAK
ncbi:MAG: hypothetical protein QM640_12315 [Niabella sp.]